MSRSFLTLQLFNLASRILYKTIVNKAKAKVQLNDTNAATYKTKWYACKEQYLGINRHPMKIKTNKYTRRLTYTRNTLPKVKIKKIEHDRAQTDMNITKIGKG